jgi:hypothetical protein
VTVTNVDLEEGLAAMRVRFAAMLAAEQEARMKPAREEMERARERERERAEAAIREAEIEDQKFKIPPLVGHWALDECFIDWLEGGDPGLAEAAMIVWACSGIEHGTRADLDDPAFIRAVLGRSSASVTK